MQIYIIAIDQHGTAAVTKSECGYLNRAHAEHQIKMDRAAGKDYTRIFTVQIMDAK